jgi:predicted nucleotidyltransferase
MEIPQKIAGLDSHRMRQFFRAFVDQETVLDWQDGVPIGMVRKITAATIREGLSLQPDEADSVHKALLEEDWIDKEKFTPTRKGMALAHHVDRPKISLDQAQAILEEVLSWAERTNEPPEARVKVKTIYLFASLLRAAEFVDDIDLFVEFTTMDLEEELQPEDMERQDELCEELAAISERVSPSYVFDRMMMDDVPMRLVFPRAG